MNTNIVMFCFGIFFIAMAVCVAFLTCSVINLRKDLKADKQLFKIILDKTNEITNHCNKVLQLMDGTIDMLRKEHELHIQAVDAMNETMTASHEMVCSFYKLKDELDDCNTKVEKLNNRLNEFDALKYIWNPATTTPYTIVNTAADDPRSDAVTDYCENDVRATEAAFNDIIGEDDGSEVNV